LELKYAEAQTQPPVLAIPLCSLHNEHKYIFILLYCTQISFQPIINIINIGCFETFVP